MKLINYDFKKYGASTERKRILEKWKRSEFAAALRRLWITFG